MEAGCRCSGAFLSWNAAVRTAACSPPGPASPEFPRSHAQALVPPALVVSACPASHSATPSTTFAASGKVAPDGRHAEQPV
eukprot:scaffold1839_cov382-Prasinococcus_capsulatus_cf.AAC.33